MPQNLKNVIHYNYDVVNVTVCQWIIASLLSDCV